MQIENGASVSALEVDLYHNFANFKETIKK